MGFASNVDGDIKLEGREFVNATFGVSELYRSCKCPG